MLHFYKLLNFCFSVLDSFIWHIKRKVLMSKLASCGVKVWIGRNWKITPETVLIGTNVTIGEGVVMQATSSKIVIGDHVMFGPNVSIHGGNHRIDILGRYMKSITLEEKRAGIDDADVVLEDDVWVGDGAIILKGVTIGKGSVIGAGVIVYENIPPYSIVTGAKMQVRRRFTEEQIEKHEKLLC